MYVKECWVAHKTSTLTKKYRYVYLIYIVLSIIGFSKRSEVEHDLKNTLLDSNISHFLYSNFIYINITINANMDDYIYIYS